MGWLSRHVDRIRRRVANRNESHAVKSEIAPRIYEHLTELPPKYRKPDIDVVSYTRAHGVTGYVFIKFRSPHFEDARLLRPVASKVMSVLPYGYRLRVLLNDRRVYPALDAPKAPVR